MISIGVALIANDCLAQLQTLLPQLAKFDQVVIGWNGSDKKVKRYLDKLCTPIDSPYEYFQFSWRPEAHDTEGNPYDINEWGFSYARNLTFNRIKTTHVLWLDTDDLIGFMKNGKDVVVSAEQAYNAFKKIAREAPEDIDVWFSTYIYSRDGNNNPNVVHARERMLKDPQRWKWVFPIHEVLVPNREPKWAMIEDVQIIHYPTSKERDSATRNLEMLFDWRDQLVEVGNQEHDLSRCLLYIGNTYWSLNEWKKAAEFLTKFIVEHPNALDIEKWQAWVFISKCQLELNNFEAARAAALAAIDVEPGLADGYILLGQVKLLTEQDPQDILLLLENAGRAEEPPPQVIQNPLDYSYTIYCITSRCKFLLGQYDAALDWAIKAQKVAPNDMRAEQLRSDAACKVRERDSVNAAKALYQLYTDYEENEKAAKIYELLPYVAQRDKDVIELANSAHTKVKHIFNRDEYIKFYSDNPTWTPAAEDQIDSENLPGKDRMDYVLSRLNNSVPKGSRILDVGCSDGFHSLVYAKYGYEVIGVDLDKRCIDLANERAKTRNLPARFVQGLFEDINPDAVGWRNYFDAVVCSEVIEHVQDPSFLLGALVDCAKEGAPVIVTTPDGAFEKGDLVDLNDARKSGPAEHVRVFTQETFEALLKSDPEVDVIESHFLPFNQAYRESQGWQVGEIRKRERPQGPVFRFYCGPNVEFSPTALEDKTKAIAGSEIAVIHMSKELAKLGCQVVVYSGVNGIYDGVFYRTSDHYNPEHRSDVLISWRIPTLFEKARPNAEKTVLWAHDLYYQITVDGKQNHIPQEWVDRIDVIFALSHFHKDFIEKVHPTFKGKVLVTRNGIDANRYLNRNIEKVPHKYFYSSDWQRGIEELLEIWPEIKKEIPDAQLHVAYSFDLIKNLGKLMRNEAELRRIRGIYAKIKAMDGVTYHDRLGQQELADLQLSCQAWLYPYQKNHADGGFLETYCITAVEAQAARCFPVTRTNGALRESVLYPIEWDGSVIKILKSDFLVSDDIGVKMLDNAQKWALKQTWESLAIDWLKIFSPMEYTTKEVAVAVS